MSEYNCYIVDDEADSIEILQDYVNQTPNLRLMFSSTDPRDILSVITNQGKPKITFLDIEMPGLTGLELASLIKTYTAIVFITSHTEHALEAFEKDAYDYLVKPVSYARFLQALLKVQGRIQNNIINKPEDDDYFFINGSKSGELIKINVDEILYLESMENYVKLHTRTGTHITYLTLKEFEFRLDRNNFLKVHRKYVVNLNLITRFIRDEVYLENDFPIPVGELHKQELKVRLNNRIMSRRSKRAD